MPVSRASALLTGLPAPSCPLPGQGRQTAAPLTRPGGTGALGVGRLRLRRPRRGPHGPAAGLDRPCRAVGESVAHSCPTLWAPMDRGPPGSSVPGILQARTLEWGGASFSRAPGASPRAGQEGRGRWELLAPCTRPGERSEQPGPGRTERAGAAAIVTLGPLSQNAPKDPNPTPTPAQTPRCTPRAPGTRPGVGCLPGSPSASADALGRPRPGRRSGTVSFLAVARGSRPGSPSPGTAGAARLRRRNRSRQSGLLGVAGGWGAAADGGSSRFPQRHGRFSPVSCVLLHGVGPRLGGEVGGGGAGWGRVRVGA